MKRLLYVVGAGLWAALVFGATFWFTFPSSTLADRLRYEVPNLLGEQYAAEIGAVSPWWVGLSIDDVKLYQKPRELRGRRARMAQEDEEGDGEDAQESSTKLVAMMRNARLRVSPWSLLRRAPYVRGSVTLTEGRIHYGLGTAVGEQGEIGLSDLEIGADALPLSDLLMLTPVTASGTGQIDLDVDLHAGENGMRDATGRIVLSGAGLSLADLELPAIGPLGIEVPIRELRLEADVAEGRATIGTGKIDSELFNVAVSGEITLREPIDRSAVDLTITLSQLGPSLAAFTTFLKDAETSEGTYQYNCRGVITRLSAYSCTAGGSRVSSRSSRPDRARTRSSAPREAETDGDREKRRAELRERLRQRREERGDARRPGEEPEPELLFDDGGGDDDDDDDDDDGAPAEEGVPEEFEEEPLE